MDDKEWHPGRKSGFQLFSKLLPQQKTLRDSVVTIDTQENITDNCCKTEGASLGPHYASGHWRATASFHCSHGMGSMKLQAKSTASTLQSLDRMEGTYLGTSQYL